MSYCSSKEHERIEANLFCQECQINMCNKCKNLHSSLFFNHHTINIGQNSKEIFTGFCTIEKHRQQLQYFCKDHNQLCCGLCITKIKGKGNGEHTNCNVCLIDEIKDEKKNKLGENMRKLEKYSNNIAKSLSKLKNINENIIKERENLVEKIGKIFTKIRDWLNNREDELLKEVNKKFDNLFDEKIIKECEGLQKSSLCIYNCLNIEDNINEINKINEVIKNFEIMKTKIEFGLDEKDINNFLGIIHNFGYIKEYKSISDEEENENDEENQKYDEPKKEYDVEEKKEEPYDVEEKKTNLIRYRYDSDKEV